MAGKEIKYSEKAREKMLTGVDTLANAVKVTLGLPFTHKWFLHNIHPVPRSMNPSHISCN